MPSAKITMNYGIDGLLSFEDIGKTSWKSFCLWKLMEKLPEIKRLSRIKGWKCRRLFLFFYMVSKPSWAPRIYNWISISCIFVSLNLQSHSRSIYVCWMNKWIMYNSAGTLAIQFMVWNEWYDRRYQLKADDEGLQISN